MRGSKLASIMLANDLQILRKGALMTRLTLFLAALAGWMNRKQQDIIDYLQAENEILNDENLQRRAKSLAAKG